MASSAAHLMGKPRVLNECFAIADGWKSGLGTFKWLADWNLALGTNYFVTHGYYSSIQGFRKYECAPTHSYQQPFWPYYKLFTDYLTNLSSIFSDGLHKCEILIYNPSETYWLVSDARANALTDELDDVVYGISRYLLEHNFDFDYIGAGDLGDGIVEEGKVFVSGSQERYEVIIFPAAGLLSEKAAAKVERFMSSGGKAIFLERIPLAETKNSEERLRELSIPAQAQIAHIQFQADHDDIACQLREWVSPEVDLVAEDGMPARDTIAYHYQKEDGDYYLIVHSNRLKGRKVSCYFPGTGEVRGSFVLVEPVSGIEVSIELEEREAQPGWFGFSHHFAPTESLLVRQRMQPDGTDSNQITEKSSLPNSLHLPYPGIWRGDNLSEVIDLSPVWQVKAQTPNYLPLTEWTFRAGLVDPANSWLVQRHTYKKDLRIHQKPNEAFFIIDGFFAEEIGLQRRKPNFYISVNGNILSDFKPSRFIDEMMGMVDITDSLIIGKNRLELVIEGGNISGTYEIHGAGTGMYLAGTFGVNDKDEITDEPLRLENGSWCTQGYPYFAGTMELTQLITVNATQASLLHKKGGGFLTCSANGQIVHVMVDGQEVGVMPWEPYRLEMPVLTEGIHTLKLFVTGTLNNVFLHEQENFGIENISWIVSP
jgi:hypothetical protein